MLKNTPYVLRFILPFDEVFLVYNIKHLIYSII